MDQGTKSYIMASSFSQNDAYSYLVQVVIRVAKLVTLLEPLRGYQGLRIVAEASESDDKA